MAPRYWKDIPLILWCWGNTSLSVGFAFEYQRYCLNISEFRGYFPIPPCHMPFLQCNTTHGDNGKISWLDILINTPLLLRVNVDQYPSWEELTVVSVDEPFLILFWTGGGHYGPDDRERPRCFRRVRATTTKIPDFVSVYVWMVPWKSFLGFVFKIFEKRKNFFLTISTSKGPPFGKKIENIKKNFFLEKIILFLFEFVLYMF